jgi:hypothetical protein
MLYSYSPICFLCCLYACMLLQLQTFLQCPFRCVSLRTWTQWTVFLQSCSNDLKVSSHVDDMCEVGDIVKPQAWKECTYLQNVLMIFFLFFNMSLVVMFCYSCRPVTNLLTSINMTVYRDKWFVRGLRFIYFAITVFHVNFRGWIVYIYCVTHR